MIAEESVVGQQRARGKSVCWITEAKISVDTSRRVFRPEGQNASTGGLQTLFRGICMRFRPSLWRLPESDLCQLMHKYSTSESDDFGAKEPEIGLAPVIELVRKNRL